MIETTYNVATPCGIFRAQWDEDESIPVAYEGDADAIAYFKAYLDMTPVSGRGGARLNFDSIEPADLYGFCQSQDYGIVVMPNADDLIDEAEEDMSDTTQTAVVLDSASDADTFALIGEGAQLLAGLDENADSFFADLARLREIVIALGGDKPALEPKPADEGKPSTDDAPVVPDPVVPKTLSDATMQTYIAAAANSIADLRRIDVYRVLNGLAADNIDGVTRSDLATWIAKNRPDLLKEVADVMAEEYAADGWSAPEDGEHRAKESAEPLPPGPVIVPPVVPDPGPTPTVNPKRADDLAFFQAVAAGTVDMWDDQLADKLEAMIADYGGDEEMREAWTQAVNAYTNFMVNAMKGI